MGSIELAGALADPEHVGRTVIVQARGGVLAGERLLVRKEKTLMGCPKLCRCHDRVIHRKPSCRHEAEGLIHPMGQLLIPVVF